MACSAYCVGNCCSTNCQAGCSSACTGGCTGVGCGGNCTGSCSGCTGGCSSGCSGTCSGCSGTCSGTCSGGCSKTCSGGCTGNCEDNCAHGCKGTCNDQCDGEAQDTNIANMGNVLHRAMLKNDISNIAKCIEHEAKRRGETPSSVTFNKGEKIDEEKINSLISDLGKAGQELTELAEEKSKALHGLGQILISKVIAAYNQIVDYDTII